MMSLFLENVNILEFYIILKGEIIEMFQAPTPTPTPVERRQRQDNIKLLPMNVWFIHKLDF